jgi:DNA polymerase-4
LDPIWSVAPCKLVAKVATRIVKPTGEFIVERGDEEEFLGPLPMVLLPGIEADDRRLLRELNLDRAAQVARLGLAELTTVFGRSARVIFETVRGIDPSPVLPAGQEPPSVRATWEFSTDTNDREVFERALFARVDSVGATLRKRRLAARRIGVILDYSDGVRFARSASAEPASANPFRLFSLLQRALGLGNGPLGSVRRVRLRHVCVVADRLVFPPAQLALFAEDQAAECRENNLCTALDRIRARFGAQAIHLGRALPATGPVPSVEGRAG